MIKFTLMIKRVLLLGLCAVMLSMATEVAPMRFERARELATQGKLDDALQEYRAILLDDPDNAQAYYEAGQIRVQQKKWNAAIQNFELSLQRNPEGWDAAVGLAQSRESAGLKDKALADWRRVADKAPKAQKDLATSHIAKLMGIPAPTTTPTTVQTPTTAKNASPSDGGKYHYDSPEFLAGEAAYQANQWAKSLEQWRKVLSVEPRNPGALYYAGVCRYNLGDYDKSILNLNRSFNYPDKGFNAHYYLGRIYEKKKENAKASAEYHAYLAQTTNPAGKADVEKRLAALPIVAVAHGGVADSANVAKPLAKDSAKKVGDTTVVAPVVKPNPEKITVLEQTVFFVQGSLDGPGATELAQALKFAQGKDYNKSIEVLKQIRLDFPNTPNALAAGYDLASLYAYLGLSENVHTLAAALLRGEVPQPYLSGLQSLLARSLMDIGELGPARTVLDSTIADLALGPTTAQKHVMESQLAELQKTEKDIPVFLEKAIAGEKDPVKRADLRLRLGQTLLRQGMQVNAEKALSDLLESCSAYTVDPCRRASYILADLAYQGKAWDKAIAQYRKVLDQYPNPEDSPWGLYQIGNAQRQQKKYTEAIATYESLIQKYPDSYWAEQGKWNRDDVVWRGQNSKILTGD